MNHDEYRLSVYLQYNPDRSPPAEVWRAAVYISHEEREIGTGSTFSEAMGKLTECFAKWEDSEEHSFAKFFGLDHIHPSDFKHEKIRVSGLPLIKTKGEKTP